MGNVLGASSNLRHDPQLLKSRTESASLPRQDRITCGPPARREAFLPLRFPDAFIWVSVHPPARLSLKPRVLFQRRSYGVETPQS